MAKSKIQGAFDFFGADPEPITEPEKPVEKSILLPPLQIEADDTAVPFDKTEAASVFQEPIAEELVYEDDAASKLIDEETAEYHPVSEVRNVVAEPYEEMETITPEDTISTKKAIEKVQKQDFTIPQHKRPSGTRGRRSVKENSIIADLVEIPADDILFQKQYYSMGDVTLMFKENHSLIRYWASEFTVLKPKKNKKGDRFFRPEDVKNLQLIHDLLRRKKYTIEGAKEYLKNIKKAEEKFAAIQSLQNMKAFFLELKANI